MSKPDPANATTIEDYIDGLAEAQRDTERDRKWLLPATVVLLGLAVGLDGFAAKLAACATLASFGYWLRAELAWSGRYWFLHYVLKHELIRPRPDMTAELTAAILEVDAIVRSAETPRSSENAAEGLSEEGEEAGPRHSAPSSAQEGHRGG